MKEGVRETLNPQGMLHPDCRFLPLEPQNILKKLTEKRGREKRLKENREVQNTDLCFQTMMLFFQLLNLKNLS